MDSCFIKLPAKFNNDRIFLYPITEDGHQLEFYTDTGGGAMLIKSSKAQELELPIIKKVMGGDKEYSLVPFPKFEEKASIPVGTRSSELFVSSDMLLGNDGFLGQPWFADRIWHFDYLNKEMGYNIKNAHYDTNGYQSTSISFGNDIDGFRQVSYPRIQANIDGEILDFLFDTGATGYLTDAVLDMFDDGNEAIRGTSFITKSMYDKWRTRHPEWEVIENADRFGVEQPERFGNGAMIQVPYVEVAGLRSGPVWFTIRPDSNFHDNMSQWMDKRVDGALGGSVFKYFSIIIDYPNSTAYFKK